MFLCSREMVGGKLKVEYDKVPDPKGLTPRKADVWAIGDSR